MSRPRLLIVNPNTSVQVTRWLADEARRVAGEPVEVVAVNAPSGLAAIETPADLLQAARSVAATIEANAGVGLRAAIVGAFGDPGLAEARVRFPIPIVGLGEAGLRAAGAKGRRFSIVTLGEAMRAPIAARVRTLGLDLQLTEINVLPMSVAAVIANRGLHCGTITDAIRAASADTVLLGGAPFAGLGAKMSAETTKTVLDGVEACVVAAGGATGGAVRSTI